MDRHAPPDRKADRQRHRGAAPPTLMHTHHTQDTRPDAHTHAHTPHTHHTHAHTTHTTQNTQHIQHTCTHTCTHIHVHTCTRARAAHADTHARAYARAHASSAVTSPSGRTELCGASLPAGWALTASHPSHPQPAAATAWPLNPAGPCPPPVGRNQLLPRCRAWASFLLESLQSQQAGCREPRSQARPASSGQPARGWTPGRLPASLPGPWPRPSLQSLLRLRLLRLGVLRLPQDP